MREAGPGTDVGNHTTRQECILADFLPSADGKITNAHGQRRLIECGCLRDLRSIRFDEPPVLRTDASRAHFEVADDIEPRRDRDANRPGERWPAKVGLVDRQLVADKPEQLAAGPWNEPGAAQRDRGPRTAKEKIGSARR